MKQLDFVDREIEKTVYVFGAGYIGKKAIYALRMNGIDVSAALDNNPSVHGTKLWDDVPCVSPESADINRTVVLCFEKERILKAVQEQCCQLGFHNIAIIKCGELQKCFEQLSDRKFLEVMHYCVHGKRLNLENPVTLNEKLQWLKLHDRNPLYITLGDKYKVRDYLRKAFGEEYLIPLLYMTYDYNDIRKENIPDTHCVIKSNCWSGDVEIIRSKDDVDWTALKEKFCGIFHSDWAKTGREWWYSHMKPCIIVESLLETQEGKLPNDYKLHYLNGKLEFVYCSIDREGANYRKIYSPEWEELPFSWNGEAAPPDVSKPSISAPETLDRMIAMGNRIAENLPYVRVDFYDVDGKLYFGEVTLSHGAGFDRFIPEKYDEIYGSRLRITTRKGENIENYIENFHPYLSPAHDVWNMDEESKEEILKLDWNEATIQPSETVKKRISEITQNGKFYHYYPNTNNRRLIGKIGDYAGVSEANVQIFPSSDSAHECIARVWLRRGDRCGLVWPAYDNFRATVELSDAEVCLCDMPECRFDESVLTDFIHNKKPKLVYICNPNNPTGELVPCNIIENILDANQGVLFIIDEAYVEFSGGSVTSLVEKYGNLVVSRTFSKAFGLANFRIGYLVSSPDNIRLLTDVRNCKNISTFAQEAALAAIEDKNSMESYVNQVKEGRNYLQNELKNISYVRKVYDSEANFVMFEVENYKLKDELIEYLRKNKIYIRDIGQTGYIKEHCARITVGTKQQMTTVVKKMQRFAYEDSII